jgi:hypothetical protein
MVSPRVDIPETVDMDRDEFVAMMSRDYRAGHSEFQMDRFVLMPELTPYGAYMQALREVNKRWRALRRRRGWVERVLGWVGIRTRDIEESVGEAEALRELRHFLGRAVALKEQIGPLDSPAIRLVYEVDYWDARARAMAADDLMVSGTVLETSWRVIHGLPKENRKRLIEEIQTESGRNGLVKARIDHQLQLPPRRMVNFDVRGLIE